MGTTDKLGKFGTNKHLPVGLTLVKTLTRKRIFL